jgi:hypothetical protein
MVGHRHTPVASAATIDSAARDQHLDNDALISSPRRLRLGRRFYGITGLLKQALCAPHIKLGGLVSSRSLRFLRLACDVCP